LNRGQFGRQSIPSSGQSGDFEETQRSGFKNSREEKSASKPFADKVILI